VQRTTTRSAKRFCRSGNGGFQARVQLLPLPSGRAWSTRFSMRTGQWRAHATPLRCDCGLVPTFRRRASSSSFSDFFKQNGLVCVSPIPREMEYRNGKLFAGGVHVTLIYKRVLIDELVKECGLEHAVVRAVVTAPCAW